MYYISNPKTGKPQSLSLGKDRKMFLTQLDLFIQVKVIKTSDPVFYFLSELNVDDDLYRIGYT